MTLYKFEKWKKLTYLMLSHRIRIHLYIDIPPLFKRFVEPLCFYERPPLVLVLANWKEFEEESKNIHQVKETEKEILLQTFPLNWGSNDTLWEANIYQRWRGRRKNEDFHFLCKWLNIRLQTEARKYSWEKQKDQVLDIF